MTDYIHPETGELLATDEEWRAALTAVEERLAPIYRVRRSLREEYASRFEAAALPGRRGRTETQEKVARCPRCGSRESENKAERAANILAIHFHAESGRTLGGRDPIEILRDLAGVLYE